MLETSWNMSFFVRRCHILSLLHVQSQESQLHPNQRQYLQPYLGLQHLKALQYFERCLVHFRAHTSNFWKIKHRNYNCPYIYKQLAASKVVTVLLFQWARWKIKKKRLKPSKLPSLAKREDTAPSSGQQMITYEINPIESHWWNLWSYYIYRTK